MSVGRGHRLVVAGLAPFVAGAVVGRFAPIRHAARSWNCPIRELTGQPCPACGSTRAFVALMARDPAWRDANWLLPLYAAGLASTGAALILLDVFAPARAELIKAKTQQLLEKPGIVMLIGVTLAAPAWLVAHRTLAKAAQG